MKRWLKRLGLASLATAAVLSLTACGKKESQPIVYLIFQKNIIAGMSNGAVK